MVARFEMPGWYAPHSVDTLNSDKTIGMKEDRQNQLMRELLSGPLYRILRISSPASCMKQRYNALAGKINEWNHLPADQHPI